MNINFPLFGYTFMCGLEGLSLNSCSWTSRENFIGGVPVSAYYIFCVCRHKSHFWQALPIFLFDGQNMYGQTDASVHILSIPLSNFLSGVSISLSLSFSLIHTHAGSHAHAHTHTVGRFLIIYTEKRPVRTSLSCNPHSAGCSVITPAVHHGK